MASERKHEFMNSCPFWGSCGPGETMPKRPQRGGDGRSYAFVWTATNMPSRGGCTRGLVQRCVQHEEGDGVVCLLVVFRGFSFLERFRICWPRKNQNYGKRCRFSTSTVNVCHYFILFSVCGQRTRAIFTQKPLYSPNPHPPGESPRTSPFRGSHHPRLTQLIPRTTNSLSAQNTTRHSSPGYPV